MYKQIPIILLLSMLFACQNSGEQRTSSTQTDLLAATQVPEPAEMKVDVIVSGRVSTLRHIDAVNVGKQIPYTYSAGKISNTPGFDWWVSKHFALKTDYPEDKARYYLELLEMSYPHYVEAFGGLEPPNIDQQRIAVVYGSSWEETMVALYDDDFRRGISAGGETMFYNRAGYNFPSHRKHHQRYIVIHETAHAFQMALFDYSGWFPIWYVEGVADSIAHHVYDEKEKQLQLLNFDRAPMDYIKIGLEEYAKANKPSIREVNADERLRRGINFLFVHYMLDHPARAHKLKKYHLEMGRMRLPREQAAKESQRLLESLFDDWAQVEKDFAAWITAVDKTFNIVNGPWEQDGNAFWVRITPPPDYRWGRKPERNAPDGAPRLDIDLRPSDLPRYSAFKMDYPLPAPTPLVGEVARGTETPALGLLIDYDKYHLHRGYVGLGLGVEVIPANLKALALEDAAKRNEAHKPDEDTVYRITVEYGDTLVIDGRRYGGERLAYPLPAAMIEALEAQQAPQLGLNVRIDQTHLIVALRAGEQAQLSYTQSVVLPANVREQLLSRPLALYADDANHRMTPYFNDGRGLNPNPPDLLQASSPNVWRNPGEPVIQRLFDALWVLREAQAPAALGQLYQAMVVAADQAPPAQAAALNRFRSERAQLAEQLAKPQDDVHQAALAALSGAHLRFEWGVYHNDGSRVLTAVLHNRSELPLSGSLVLGYKGHDGEQRQVAAETVELAAGAKQRIPYTISPPVWGQSNWIEADAQLQWSGQDFRLQARSEDREYPGVIMEIQDPAMLQGDEITVAVRLTGPHGGDSKGKLFFEVQPGNLVEQARFEQDVDMQTFATQIFTQRFKLKPGMQPERFAVQVQADIVPDGEAVGLRVRSVYQE